MDTFISQKKVRRRVRYTLLLSQAEYRLAKQVAASDYRSVPDFLRAQILKAAESLRSRGTKTPQSEVAQKEVGDGEI
jgi:hypothetical protein